MGGGERAEDDEGVGEVERQDHDHQPERVEHGVGPRPVPPPKQVHALHQLTAHLKSRHAGAVDRGGRAARSSGGGGELRLGFSPRPPPLPPPRRWSLPVPRSLSPTPSTCYRRPPPARTSWASPWPVTSSLPGRHPREKPVRGRRRSRCHLPHGRLPL
ncbi:hypothetical protein OsI_26512 [Oryza sativa Indica Group]|uniref:Uncharacterized protein n=1 Tax=Oryza sativa subsp. indica TaxID=39946 RepID=B8B7H2_ORYSI|nr:hypothetical protein OsI_26512 [Oryza sativa Indica Group]